MTLPTIVMRKYIFGGTRRAHQGLHHRILVVVSLVLAIFLYLQLLILENPGEQTDREVFTPGVENASGHKHTSWCQVKENHSYVYSFSERNFLHSFENGVRFGRIPPQWQSDLYEAYRNKSSPKSVFYLSEILMVRIYTADKAKWTVRELKQWLHYMFLTGVEHVYVCEHFHPVDEIDLEKELQQYISLGLISFTRIQNVSRAMTAQVNCYRDWVKKEGSRSTWMMAIDMDEYPFHMTDHSEHFLLRYLGGIKTNQSTVVEIAMPNYLMLGQGDRIKDMVIDRITRSTPKAWNHLVKPIFLPKFCKPDIHFCTFDKIRSRGSKIHANTDELRMLHYWGARMQDWGPDTEYTRKITRDFTNMADIWGNRLRNSLLVFGEADAFSNNTGP